VFNILERKYPKSSIVPLGVDLDGEGSALAGELADDLSGPVDIPACARTGREAGSSGFALSLE
jgi:hypothetical protein